MSLAVLCTFLQPCVMSELVSATYGTSELSDHCPHFFLSFPFFFFLFFFLSVWDVGAAGSLSLKQLWGLWCDGNCLVQPEHFTSLCGTCMTILGPLPTWSYLGPLPTLFGGTCGSKSFFHCPRLERI